MDTGSVPQNNHSTQSSRREMVLDHAFMGELLRYLWRTLDCNIEVLRSQVDNAGYDVVLDCNGICRHVQFKSSHRESKTREVGINMALAAKPSGCVIWIMFDQHTMDLGPYLWFGGKPGRPLPSLGGRVIKHTKGNRDGYKAERPNMREVRKSQFKVLQTMEDVAVALFGKQTI
jgi:hypothetical protein